VARILSHPQRPPREVETITVATNILARNMQAKDRNAAIRELRERGATRDQIKHIVQAKLGKLVKVSHIDQIASATSTHRGEAESAAFKDAIIEIARIAIADWKARNAGKPGIRHIFYRTAAAGVVPKDEDTGYIRVRRVLGWARMNGILRPDSFFDPGRRTIQRPNWDGIEHGLQSFAAQYHRPLWDDADCTIQIWIEKQAMVGLIRSYCWEWDLPIYPSRGDGGISQCYEAACDLDVGLPAYVLHLGDFDSKGEQIPETIESKLRKWAPGADIDCKVIAITPKQIRDWDLPTRAPKEHDTKAGWRGGCTELDTLSPDQIVSVLKNAVEPHIIRNRKVLDATLAREKRERKRLLSIKE